MDVAWENFLEAIAGLISMALTDKEAEKVIAGFQNFQQKLQRLSSHNLQKLNVEITQAKRKDHCKHEGKTCKQNVTRGFLKTWVVAYLIKYLIGVLPAVLMGKAFKNPSIFKKAGGKDTVGFAFFLSSFLSAYKGVLCAMRHFRPDHDGDRLNAFVAGSLAGLTLLLDKNKSRRTALTLYIFTRALQFGSSYGMKQWAEARNAKRSLNHRQLVFRDELEMQGGLTMTATKPSKRDQQQQLVTKPTWGDIVANILTKSAAATVMSLTASVNLYSFVIEPYAMPVSYYHFLLQHSGLPQKFGSMASPLLDHLRTNFNTLRTEPRFSGANMIPKDMTTREYIGTHMSPNLAQLYAPNMHHDYQMCALLHPLHDCKGGALDTFKGEFGRAIKMYGTLNVLMTLVFQHKKLMEDPQMTVKKFIKSTLRSTLFLTIYVWFAFSSPCMLRRLIGRESYAVYLLNGILSGLTVLIEVPGRRMELALYCLPRALETGWRMLLKRGLVKNIKHGEIALFSASMGVLMTLYQNDQSVINRHYLTVMTRVFGRN